MVPLFRLGLGPLLGNPLTGYVMVLKTTGRKTGRVRFAPVNYAILDGQVYCLAGWGQIADWYRNLRAQPQIELLLPGGPVAVVAEDVADPDERLRATRQVMQNGGFAGFLLGFNPFTAPDAVLREKTEGLPVVRLRPIGLGSGAGDPGGWLWMLSAVAAGWLALRWARKPLPRLLPDAGRGGRTSPPAPPLPGEGSHSPPGRLPLPW
ncbi:MAG: nitroreductase family deazaflavin-dependent oxidoreductase [Chloroflexi bacterium]|nr:nitroreductase family deazaflavin-dependent oxidoreductase [Chloroflexota bacterium]